MVVLSGLKGSVGSVGIGDHRPELPGRESCSILPHALVAVEDRAPVFELDTEGDHCPERRRPQQAGSRQNHVKRPFQRGTAPAIGAGYGQILNFVHGAASFHFY